MDLPNFTYFLLLIRNEVIGINGREQIITSLQDGRLNLNDSLTIEDVQLSHGLLNLHNAALSTLDFEFDDALEDVHIINAVANSIKEWKLRKFIKNSASNGVNKKRVKRDEEVVCYRNFGCFRDEGPFDYLDTLPASPDTINTTFTLFTRDVKNGEPLDYLNVSTLTGSKISVEKPVKIIVHGFGSSGKRPWVVQMTEALIYMEDVNVIVVDWENGAALPNYVQAAANTQLVGKQIARLINTINQNLNFEAKDYHLIGFSLGAHICGFAGAEVKNISRITGLDPASPLFEGYSVRARLDPSDAKFVDVIHSNGDSFLKGGLGSFQAMGHLDFYPNGGRVQVGCNSVLVGALTDIFYGKWQSLCHHRRAFRFFIDSLVPSCRFAGFACDSYENFLKGECFSCGESGRRCANMGYYANNSKGKANQYKIRIISSNTQHSTWGKLEISFISKDANETFQQGNNLDEIKDKAILQGLVVAHPIIRNITHVLLKYTKYRGWIYSGKDFWAVDKIILQNSDGDVFSYCGFNTVIQNNESVLLNLERKNCTLYEPSTDLPTARVARLIWKVVSTPIRPPAFSPLSWRLSDYNPINKFNYHINNGLSPATASQLANYNSFNIQQTGLYNLNPNLINTSNQKQPFSTYPNINSLNANINSNLNTNNNLINLNKLKTNSFTNRHQTTPTAITTTTTTTTHQDSNVFKLNSDRLNNGVGQNELEFNENTSIGQKQQINKNDLLNQDELDHHKFNNSQLILNQLNNNQTLLINNLSNTTIAASSLEIN